MYVPLLPTYARVNVMLGVSARLNRKVPGIDLREPQRIGTSPGVHLGSRVRQQTVGRNGNGYWADGPALSVNADAVVVAL